jgi:hypothetical protein
VRRLEVELAELRARAEAQPQRVANELKKELLPLEQVTPIAQALAGMWKGASVSMYGDEAKLMGAVGPVVELLTERLRRPRARA